MEATVIMTDTNVNYRLFLIYFMYQKGKADIGIQESRTNRKFTFLAY